MTTTISMIKLSELLNEKGIKANFEMSGGNCGTIYIGEFNKEGYAEFAVGPSSYSQDSAHYKDFYWGLDDDGESDGFRFEGAKSLFTEVILADRIANDYTNSKVARNSVISNELANVIVEIGGESFEFYAKKEHGAYYQVGKLGEIGEFYIPMNEDNSADIENVGEIEVEWENA